MAKIIGTELNDIIEDLNTRDEMTGLGGLDRFKLAQDSKVDSIMDFQNGADKIDVTAFNVTWGLVQVKLKTEDTFVISIGGERTFVTFENTGTPPVLADLGEDDFIFATNANSAPPNIIVDRPVTKDHWGTDGVDIFEMVKDYRRDVLRKFDPTKDKIDLTDFSTNFDDLEFVDRKPGKVIIKLGTEGLVIRDLSRSLESNDITEDMFIF